MAPNESLTKATKFYAQHARDWKFLGYSEPLALAVLMEFFSMGKVRNPSPKPLNVLSMVGKSRVKQLRDEVARALEEAAEPLDEASEAPEISAAAMDERADAEPT